MASTVYASEEIELRDGTSVTLRPLSIFVLRKFMEKFDELQKTEDEHQALNVLFALGCIGLEEQLGEEAVKDEKVMATRLDVPTINRIIKVAGGIDLEAGPKVIADLTAETPGTS